jgi:hypothetical protein
MRRRRFSERQRVGMWWAYTLVCIVLYFALFAVSDFLTALVATLAAIALGGVLVKWLSSL